MIGMSLLVRLALLLPPNVPQIPVLCYHQIRDWRPKDRTADKAYIMPPATFRLHMKMLADSGYHAILPDELYAHLTKGTPLPSKPVMLTFDDTDGDQYSIARPEMAKYGFKGVYFIVFNNINKNKYYMSRAQIRQLSDEGHVIACHTLTHPNIRKLKGSDWAAELDVPARKLELLTGKPVRYFAYPFGIWDQQILPELSRYGYLAAFQLDEPRDSAKPLLTVRRVIDDGRWDTSTLDRYLKHGFGHK
ncbi:polysaccharide deacetylase family protein [Mucilaginibacter mali]|uniref:Polysaccharide deacetylase family protein n=1 Tax=Mucilaginibacter mali TaxID=2740462 RepID=A0A7D4QTU5_9SPHI|nr:polysaccharide deacetylase family protein [Mucilaginibacter mali]QKJ30769.1 polysaccharide deacetylase family protein [Mucilaginibacter mali]